MFTEKDFLKVHGDRILTADGRQVIFRGTNFGGWLMREGWMDGGSTCEKPIEADVVGMNADAVTLKLSETAKINRIHVGGLQGKFRVLGSMDGADYFTAGEGDVDEKRALRYREGYPVDYMLHGNAYDDGCFYAENTVYVNEFTAGYVRLEGRGMTGRITLGDYADVDDYTSRRVMKERFGAEAAEELLDAYKRCFITERDVVFCKSLGFNFIRVPLYWQTFMTPDGNIKNNAFEMTDAVLEWGMKHEVYIMLDYHGAPGGNSFFGITCGQQGVNDLWYNHRYLDMSCRILQALAKRYLGCPALAAYDLLNEPMPGTFEEIGMTEDHRPKMDRISRCVIVGTLDRFYHAMREIDRDHIMGIELFLDNRVFRAPEEYGWENVIYQTHTYPQTRTDRDQIRSHLAADLKEYAQLQREFRVPMFCGESNVWGYMDIWREWLAGLTELGMGWTTWTYKNIDPLKSDSWGLLYDFQGELPDYYWDDYDTLKRKLSAFGSENYVKNEEFIALLSQMAKL